MSKTTRGILAAAALCLFMPVARGELLVHYSFDASNLAATSVHANLTSPAFAVSGAGDKEFYAGAAFTTYGYSSTQWMDTGNYFHFKPVVENGFIMHVTNLTFYGRRSAGAGPTNWVARYSTDGSTFHTLGTGVTGSGGFFVAPNDCADIEPVDLTGTNDFRIYGTDAAGNSGTFRIDEVKLYGTVVPDTGARYIKYQSFDAAHHDNWAATTNVTNATAIVSSDRAASGGFSLRLGGSNKTNEDPFIVFDNVNLEGVSHAVLSIGFAADGPDQDDDLYVDVSYDDGASWTGAGSTQLVDGLFAGGQLHLAFGATTPADRVPCGANPYAVAISGTETQVRARVRYDETNKDNLDDYYYIDSVALRGVPTPQSSASPDVSNYGGITDIATDSAVVRGHVIAAYPYPTVTIYYGPVDGGGGLGTWSRSTNLGVKAWGIFTHTLSGLSAGTKYYYRCHVENSEGAQWADSSTNFTTLAGTIGAGTGIYIDELGVADVKPLSIDADGNGIADRWQDAYLAGKMGDDATSGGDPDSDGQTNLEEFYAGTDPDNSNSYMRIVGADLPAADSSDLAISWVGGGFYGPTQFVNVGDAQTRTFSIRACDEPGESKSAYGTASGLLLATNTWTDTNAVIEAAHRFYEISVSMAGSNLTNTQEWGMFVQPRAVSNRYLVSVPVDLGTNNTLNGELGQQVARGLSFGTTTTGDKLYLLQDDGSSLERVLVTNDVGDVLWWNVQAAAEATDIITPGMGIRLVRESESNEVRTNAVMVGKTYVRTIDPLTFNTNSAAAGWKWRLFGWPYAKAIASTGESDPFGFYTNGAYGGIKGSHTADHADRGDQIWVWDGERQSFRYYYLLDGVDGRADLDGVWWDLPRRTHAVFSLEPGKAYYYRHHVATNGPTTGTNFIWQPKIVP